MSLKVLQKRESKISEATWLSSFTDLLMLILTFFVMIYATKEHQDDEWKGVVESFDKFFSGTKEIDIKSTKDNGHEIDRKNISLRDITYFRNFFRYKLTEGGFSSQYLEFNTNRRQLILTIQPDKYSQKEFFTFTETLKNIISKTANMIEIEYITLNSLDSLKYAKSFAKLLKEMGFDRKVFIKLNPDILLPEKADINQNIGKLRIIINTDEEI